jgi:exosome complex exonuclease DIS3/RRP44
MCLHEDTRWSLLSAPSVFSRYTMIDDTRRLNSFLRKTRRGHVLKITHELYLRTDIPCGSHACQQCPIDQSTVLERQMTNGNSLVPAGHYLLVDTNIVLQQVD